MKVSILNHVPNVPTRRQIKVRYKELAIVFHCSIPRHKTVVNGRAY